MAVNLKFYNKDAMELETIDGGTSRINFGQITPIKIKNEGQDKARNCIISSSTLNTLDELKKSLGDSEGEKEYNKQVSAASWKTFSLAENGEYKSELNLGKINPNSFLEGTETIQEQFSNKDKSLFQDSWSFCKESWGNGALKVYKDQAKSQTAQRKEINIGSKRDIDIKFKLKYEFDSSAYAKSNCLVIFPVRVDDRGYGYILSFQFRASDGKCYFGVYKNGKGMLTNLNRTYGTRIFDTNAFLEFDQSKYLGAKVYTNEDDETCFEFTLNGEKQVLYRTKDKKKIGTTVVDTENNHPKAGGMFFDVGMYYGDLAVTLSNFTITTETDQQVVYIKSKIDGNAKDNEDYKSAITVSYTEG